MLELYELNVFLQAAEVQSFTGAAERLHISQPAVSMQISNLENRLNLILFDRSSRNVRLTEEGEALLPLAREILNYGTHIEEAMASLHGQVTGHLQIGCSTSGGRYVLPHLIARFRQQHPKVRITVNVCTPAGAVEQVCDGRSQLGILSREAASRDIEHRSFFEDRVILIAPTDHPFARRESIHPRELVGQPVILREETSGTRLVMQAGLLDYDIRVADLDVVMELGSAEAIIVSVEAGIGVAFISQIVAARRIEHGAVAQVPIQGLDLTRQLYMIRHSRRAATRVQAAFWDFCHCDDNRAFLQGLGASPVRTEFPLS